jgi:general secretion pathway protein L
LKAAGLSIEGAKVKVSIVERRLGSAKLIASDELVLPSTPEERKTTLTDALNKWKSSYDISGVTVGLDLSSFSHRVVELPVRSAEDIRHALVFEMEKHLPLEPDEYSTDFHTLETSKDGTKNLVLAIRKERVAWIFDCLVEAGLKFLGVKCTAIEAANELMSSVNISDALIVYPSDGKFQVIGLKDSNPVYLKLLKSREAAIADIERNLDAYGKTLYVAGGASTVEFDRFSPRTMPLNMPSVLASLTAGKSRVKIDLVPEEFSTPKKDYYPLALVILCVACVVIFFSTSILAYVKDYRALSSVKSSIEKIKGETREVIETERKVAAARDKLSFLNKFQYNKNTKVRILAELSWLLPKSAWLTSLSVDEQGTVEIEGFAGTAADIISPLENSPLFKDVEFSSPVTVREGTERFSLKMYLEEAEEGQE